MVVTARMKGSRYLDSIVAKGENRQLIFRICHGSRYKMVLSFIKTTMYDRIILSTNLSSMVMVPRMLHPSSHSIVVLLPSGGNRWRLLREKRSVKTPQEAIFADEEAEPSSRKAEPISGAFPSTDKQSTLLHGIMELDTLHHLSYRYHHSFKIKIGPHPIILRILYFFIYLAIISFSP